MTTTTTTAATKAQAAAAQTFDRTMAGIKDGVATATTSFTQAQATATKQFEKVARVAEDVAAFNQGTLEAYVRSTQTLWAGSQDLARQAADLARAASADALAAVQALTAATSVKEKLDLQARLTRTGVEKSLAETTRFARASFQLAEQAAAPLTARAVLAAEKFAPRG